MLNCDFHATVFFYNTGIMLIQETNFMTWVEDVSVIKRMVETQQDIVNVTLANNSSQLCKSGHLPASSLD